MTKRILALVLALCLCLSVSAYASSGEASGGASGGMGGASVFACAVSADGVENTEAEDVRLTGDVSADGISGFAFESSDTCFVSVTGDDTTEGAVSYKLGGNAANYDAAELAIDAGAQEKLGFASFDSTIHSTTGSLVTARGGAHLELDGVYARGTTGILTAGSDSDRYSGSSDMDYIDTVVVLRDCYLDTGAYTADTIAEANWPHATTLMVRGCNRSALSIGESETYYYGSAVVADGWAAMATDSAVGMGLDMVAYNSYARTLLGGYCSYSDSRCRDFLYGTTYESAEYGSIIANFGELYVLNTDDAANDTNVLRAESGAPDLAERAAVDPLAYAGEDDLVDESCGSVVAGFRNAVMMHVPDLMGGGAKISDGKGVLYVKDSTIGTYYDLAPADYEDGGYEKAWVDRAGEANFAYLEYTMGAAVLIRSDNACIHLTNATVDSWTGVLIQSALNADSKGNWIAADAEPGDNIGIDVLVDGDTALVGEIRHEDYQRTMRIAFADDASLNGDIVTGTVDSWHAAFADYAESGANFYRDADGYDRVWGTEVSMAAGTVWTVSGTSNITALTLEKGAVVNGAVTVDGKAVDVSAGGSWSGDIVLTAAASAEADAVPATDGSENRSNTFAVAAQPASAAEFDGYVAYLRGYMETYEGSGDGSGFDDGARSMALGELDAVSFGSDVAAFPFEMFVTQFGAMDFAAWSAANK